MVSRWDGVGRYCNRCDEYKVWGQFAINKKGVNDKKSICKECSNTAEKALNSKRKMDDLVSYKLLTRGRALKKNFGITLDFYNTMLEKQNGSCAICDKTEPSGKNLAVDHCHTTGKIRGLLCTNCNSAIGKLGDTSVAVLKAVTYLERFENGL